MIPGLVGELHAHFSEGEVPVDEGHALGTAINVMASVARYHNFDIWRPAVFEALDAHVPSLITFATIVLVGPPRFGGRELIKRNDELNWKAFDPHPCRGNLFQRVYAPPPPTISRTSTLYAWEPLHRSGSFDHDFQILIPPNGVFRTDPKRDPQPLLERLHRIKMAKDVMVQMDSLAKEAFRGTANHWVQEGLDNGNKNDVLFALGARLDRWAHLAALFAIGVNHEQPLVNYTQLERAKRIAIDDHDAIWNLMDPAKPTNLTVVQ
jgi:hypothetical protein